MRIPSRAQVDAFCGSPTTRYQRIAGILAPLILLGTIVYILIIWHTLPEQIPTHYNFAGEIDGYGGRGSLLLMPIIGLAYCFCWPLWARCADRNVGSCVPGEPDSLVRLL